MRFIYIVLLILIFGPDLHAQQGVVKLGIKDIRNLRIGDELPDMIISKIINNDIKSISTADFKESLLILDFWDTFCKSCIEALPKMDSLQHKFGKRIKILPVSWQSRAVLTRFFKTNNFVKDLKLPCVTEDTLLSSYFRHKIISHEVWIYKGVIKAITGSPYVTASNIQDVLDNKVLKWPVKNEFPDYDYEKPLMHLDTNQYCDNKGLLQYAAITGYKNGAMWKAGSSKDSLRNTVRNYMINYPIIQLYYLAMSKIKKNPFSTIQAHVVLEVRDKSKYYFNPDDGFEEDWNQRNTICFETMLPNSLTDKEQGKIMLADLNRLLRLNGRIERREIPCLVLVKDENQNDSLVMSRSNIGKTMGGIIMSLNMSRKYPPVIDETEFKDKIDLGNWSDLKSLKALLKRKGFDIQEASRKMDVFVLTELD